MKSFLDNKIFVVILGLIGVALVGFIDFVTGYDLGFFVFYFIPILFVAWKADLTRGIITSILSAVVWGSVDYASGHPYSNFIYYFWNAGIRLGSFVILAVLVDQVQALQRRQKQLKYRFIGDSRGPETA